MESLKISMGGWRRFKSKFTGLFQRFSPEPRCLQRFLYILFWLGVSSSSSVASTNVLNGLDVLREDDGTYLNVLFGKRIGLITNHTGQTRDGIPSLLVLRDELKLSVVALFSPEHGFAGNVAAGADIASDVSGEIPVYSLYGRTRKPSVEMLADIDVLVFDIQDIGVRFYTYISTLKLAMEAAAEAQLSFVVLDRPNPNGGLRVEGPVLNLELLSFVGIAPIALLHGMTVGELAQWFHTYMELGERLFLSVIPIKGWSRSMRWRETGLPWVAPSPNIRTVKTSIAYPAFGLIEGVNVSEGRGTELTFEQIGAPWIDGDRLAQSLNALGLPGVVFRPTHFIPRATVAAPRPKYEGVVCNGVAISISDDRLFHPVRTGLATIATIRALYPSELNWIRTDEGYWVDFLLGTERTRIAIDKVLPLNVILDDHHEQLQEFVRSRASHLLYEAH